MTTDLQRKMLNPAQMGRWAGGMNNVDDVHELGATQTTPAFLREAVNVDMDRAGKARRRKGYTRIAGGKCHSVFGDQALPFGLVVQDGQLSYFDRSGEPPVAITPLDAAAPVSYALFNGAVYFGNGLTNGIVLPTDPPSLHPWGVPTPPTQPVLETFTYGGFAAGRYQVAITWVSVTGEESGAMLAGQIDVPEGSGILLDQIPQPQDASITLVRVYVSPANGDAMYALALVPVGTTTYYLRNALPGRMLETMGLDQMPAGSIVRAYKGRLYVAVGNRIYYSDPLRYGLTSVKNNYLQFPSTVTMIEAVDDGLYVGDEQRTVHLAGTDPKTFTQSIVDLFGAVPGASGMMSAADLDNEQYQGPIAVWWNTNGNLCKGTVSGAVGYLTRGRLSLPRYERGCVLFREIDGNKQILSAMKNPESVSFGAYDSAVATVIRNGVQI